MYLCIEFQEEYKQLDLLCKDCYKSQNGVSEYIRLMDSIPYKSYRLIPNWENDHNQLKHIRWIRNKLAHEVGTLESDICTESDINWIKNFRQRIINGNDPLTLLRKASEESKINTSTKQKSQHTAKNSTNTLPTQASKTKTSWFTKLLNKLKKIFHN